MTGKKGVIQPILIFSILLVIFIGYSFFDAAREHGQSGTFSKRAFARDIGVALEAVHGIDGDVRVAYPVALPEYSLTFEREPDTLVHVYEVSIHEATKGVYEYVGTRDSPEVTLRDVRWFMFEKKDDVITIQKCETDKCEAEDEQAGV